MLPQSSPNPITAETIARALGGRWHHWYWMCRCPAHRDRTPSLLVKDESAGVDLHCWAHCPQLEIINALTARGLWNDATNLSVKPRGPTTPEYTKGHLAAKRLWERSRDPRGTLAETYLGNRGLPLPNFACDRALAYADAVPLDGTFLPALVARLIPVRYPEFPCVHVIFLKPDGSGYIDKRTWGSPFGPALVYLSPPDDFTTELHIGEGIETMLGAYHKHGAYPITAALGSLAYVPITPHECDLFIWADNDDPGRDAARRLGRRWQLAGRNVSEIRRRQANTDFADPHPKDLHTLTDGKHDDGCS